MGDRLHTEDRGQRKEGKGQRTEDKVQRKEDRGQFFFFLYLVHATPGTKPGKVLSAVSASTIV